MNTTVFPDLTKLSEALPEMIPATALPGLLGNVYTAKYLSNLRHIGAGPRAYRLGRKIVHLRADVIGWLKESICPFDPDAAA